MIASPWAHAGYWRPEWADEMGLPCSLSSGSVVPGRVERSWGIANNCQVVVVLPGGQIITEEQGGKLFF